MRWRGSLILVSLCFAMGCHDRNNESGLDEGLFAEAVTLRESFSSAKPALRNPVAEALKLIRAGAANPSAFAEVIPQLQKLAAHPDLTAAQKQALTAVVQKLQAESHPAPRR